MFLLIGLIRLALTDSQKCYKPSPAKSYKVDASPKYTEYLFQYTVPKNGISGGRKCNTTNCIPYEAASKMDHFDEIKTIISRKNKKIFDILCFPIFFR